MHNSTDEVVPDVNAYLNILKDKFSTNANDEIAQAEAAAEIRKDQGWTFAQTDDFLSAYKGWCMRHLWMADLSSDLKAMYRERALSQHVAKLLAPLDHHDQNRMVAEIYRQQLDPRKSHGVYALIKHMISEYEQIVEERKSESRSVAQSGFRKRISLHTKTVSRNPLTVELAEATRILLAVQKGLKIIAKAKPEDLVGAAEQGRDLFLLLQVVRDSSEVLQALDPHLTMAWKAKIAGSYPGLIKEQSE